MIQPVATLTSPLRTYVLLHTYLKSLLNGVQGAHAVADLLVKYPEADGLPQTWARDHKTLVFLDGGVSLHIHQTIAWLKSMSSTSIPWAAFVEDSATLENMTTAIAITLPESIAKASDEDVDRAEWHSEGPLWDELQALGVDLLTLNATIAFLRWLRSRPLAS